MKSQHSKSKLNLNKRSIAKLNSKKTNQIRGGSIPEIFTSSLKCILATTVTIVYTQEDCG